MRIEPATSSAARPVLGGARAPRPVRAAAQAGIVLIYALVALVILMVSALALVRGASTALAVSGNFALRRDMINQGELGVSSALAAFSTAGAALNAPGARWASNAAVNYSATTLADSNGIPTALLDDNVFAATGTAGNDIAGTYGISIRYVIDRLCTVNGAPTLANCAAFKNTGDKGGTNWLQKAGNTFQPVYRITVRVTGPKNAMTFLQTTIGV